MRANGRGRRRVGTPYYIIRARMRSGEDGRDGVNGGGWERDSAKGIAGRGLLPDGGNTFTREGKGGYMAGEKKGKGKGGKKKNPLLVGEVRDFINL